MILDDCLKTGVTFILDDLVWLFGPTLCFEDPPRDVENFTCISENWDNLNCTWVRKSLMWATFLVYFFVPELENHWCGQQFWSNFVCTWVRKSLIWATFLGKSLTWATFLVWFFWQLSTFSWPGWAVEPYPDQIPTHDQTGQLQICVSGYWWDRGVDLMVIGDSFVCLTWNLWFNLYL